MNTFDREESETRYQTAIEMQEMSLFALLKPSLTVDGNQWSVMYGENLQVGICGFGNSPSLAIQAWNKEWYKEIKVKSAPEILERTKEPLDDFDAIKKEEEIIMDRMANLPL